MGPSCRLGQRGGAERPEGSSNCGLRACVVPAKGSEDISSVFQGPVPVFTEAVWGQALVSLIPAQEHLLPQENQWSQKQASLSSECHVSSPWGDQGRATRWRPLIAGAPAVCAHQPSQGSWAVRTPSCTAPTSGSAGHTHMHTAWALDPAPRL